MHTTQAPDKGRASAVACHLVLVAATGALGAAAACAAPLADPTRPPALAMPPATSASVPRTDTAARTALEPRALPLLQSVQLPERGQATALVDGRIVQTGDRIGERVILSIDQHGLLLRAAQGSDRLWLLSSTLKQLPGTLGPSRSAQYVPSAQPLPGAPGKDAAIGTVAEVESPPPHSAAAASAPTGTIARTPAPPAVLARATSAATASVTQAPLPAADRGGPVVTSPAAALSLAGRTKP